MKCNSLGQKCPKIIWLNVKVTIKMAERCFVIFNCYLKHEAYESEVLL